MTWYRLGFVPVKRRPRFTKSGRAYDPHENKAEARLIKESYDGPKFDGPVSLTVYVMKPTPKRARKPMPFVQKPDLDNVLKAVMDGLIGAAYDDDSQVVEAHSKKLDREPGIQESTIYEVRGFDAGIDA